MANFWGGGNTSKEYLMRMADESNPLAKPADLIGHTLSNYNTDQIDRVTAIGVELVRGRIQEIQRVLRRAVQTQVTGTVGFGSEGNRWTPLLQKVRKGSCELTIYIQRKCPAQDQFAHFFALRNTVFDPPSFVNDLITNDDTTNIVTEQSNFAAPKMHLIYQVGANVLTDLTPPLYAISVITEECADCEEGIGDRFVVGGGAGGPADAAYLAKTLNRFGAMTVLTHGVADGNVFKGVYTDGDVILAGFADDVAPGTAATGGTAFSNDGGDSFTLDSNISVAINGVGYFDKQYIAVGGDGGAGGNIYVSDDGITWTAVVSAAIPGDEQLTSIAVDKENDVFYVAGTGGTLLKGSKTGSNIVLQALTPAGVVAQDLLRVAVFGSEHVAVGGSSNYYGESFDGGATWVNPSIPGSGDVAGIAGLTDLRAAAGAGTIIAARDILSENQYQSKTPVAGATITGNFTDLINVNDDPEYFFGVTDDGEVVGLFPFYPGA